LHDEDARAVFGSTRVLVLHEGIDGALVLPLTARESFKLRARVRRLDHPELKRP
jgi:hypothetical protein